MSRPARERKAVSYVEDPIEDSDLDEPQNVRQRGGHNAAQHGPILKFAQQPDVNAAARVARKPPTLTKALIRSKAEAQGTDLAPRRQAPRNNTATPNYREEEEAEDVIGGSEDGASSGNESDEDFEAAAPKRRALTHASSGSEDELDEADEPTDNSASDEEDDGEESPLPGRPAARTSRLKHRGGAAGEAAPEPLRRPGAGRRQAMIDDSEAEEEAADAATASGEDGSGSPGAGEAAKSWAQQKPAAPKPRGSDGSGSDADSDEFQESHKPRAGKVEKRLTRTAPARQQPRRAAREVLPPDLKQFAFRSVSPPPPKREAPPKRGAAKAAAGKLQQQRQQQRHEFSGSGDEGGSGSSSGSGDDAPNSDEEGGEEEEVISVSGSGSEEGASGDEEGDEAAGLQLQVAGPAKVQGVIRQRKKLPGVLERCLQLRYVDEGEVELSVKFKGLCYRKVAWVTHAVAEAARSQVVRNFMQRAMQGDTDLYNAEFEDGVDPEWLKVDRVIAERSVRGKSQYLVKWCGLEYSDATWEAEADLAGDEVAIERFLKANTPPARPINPSRPTKAHVAGGTLPAFLNGRALRDYQQTSLHWMLNNYRGNDIGGGQWAPRNCILGDEMGLGKTAQSISVLAFLYQYCRTKGPFLVVAPLTTLGHWRREIETWTDMYCVVFAGSAADRAMIVEHELQYPGDRRGKHGAKFDVLLTSYETILREKSLMRQLQFQVAVLDEAHRLKGINSQQRAALCDIPIKWKLLLTGTPIQNNMRELYGMMNLLDPVLYNDVDDFLEQYGDEAPSVDQVKELQAALAPVLLRRMKEDVETLPEKEEVVIWVELTVEQRLFYKALYSQQIGALLGGAKGANLPQMRNLAMELRKLCCHPYLCNGLEDEFTARRAAQLAAAATERELLVRASGKMVLLDKLLPKLRAEGKKVLIFSQFKIMLNVLEDYLTLSGYPFERIDGSVAQRDRQAAIDRFSKVKEPSPPAAGADDAEGGAGGSGGGSPGAVQVDEDSFVFLLSTRAGGQGITLTAADTVILYDSDWNPQNDLQAMARCHRIGQVSDVTVYRLVSKDTYEQRLFEVASRKYGLDEAVLGFSSGADPEQDAKRITELLTHGAHALVGADDATEGAQDGGFAAEDIDQILTGRTEKRQIGSRKGNTFSTAHFAAEEDAPAPAPAAPAPGAAGAREYWAAVLPDAVQAHDEAQRVAKMPEILGPRRRTKVNYNIDNAFTELKTAGKKRIGEDNGDDSSDDYAEPAAAAAVEKKKKAPKVKEAPKEEIDPQLGRVVKPWNRVDADLVERLLMRLGEGRPEHILAKANFPGRQADEVKQLTDSILRILHLAADMEASGTLQPAPKPMTIEELLAGDGRDATAADAAEAVAGPSGAGGEAGTSDAAHGAAAAADAAAAKQTGKDSGSALQAAVQALSPPLPPAVVRGLSGKELLRRLGNKPGQQLEALAEHARVHAMAQSEEGLPHRKVTWSKRMPSWWSPDMDRSLMAGCYGHGFSTNTAILKMCVEDVLCDPTLPFAAKVALDAADAADLAEFQGQEQAAGAGGAGAGGAAAGAGTGAVVPEAAGAGGDRVTLAASQGAAGAAPAAKGPKLVPLKEWERLKKEVATRAKAVRTAMLDAAYQPPPPTYLGKRILAPVAPGSGGGAAAAAGGEGGQQPKRPRLSDEGQDGSGSGDDDFMPTAAGNGVGGSGGAGGSGSGSKRPVPEGGAAGDGSGAVKKPRSASKPAVGANRKALLAARAGGKGGMDAFVVKRMNAPGRTAAAPQAVAAGVAGAGPAHAGLAAQVPEDLRAKVKARLAAGNAAAGGRETSVMDLTAGSPARSSGRNAGGAGPSRQGKGAAVAAEGVPAKGISKAAAATEEASEEEDDPIDADVPQAQQQQGQKQQRPPGSSGKAQLQQLLSGAGPSQPRQQQPNAASVPERSPLAALEHNTSGSSGASQQPGGSGAADAAKPAVKLSSGAGAGVAGGVKGGVKKAVDNRKMVQQKLSFGGKPKPAKGA